MVFDPSFRHETFNPTAQERCPPLPRPVHEPSPTPLAGPPLHTRSCEQDRIILNIDLFHPELTDLECRVIQETIRLKKELFGSTKAQEWRGP